MDGNIRDRQRLRLQILETIYGAVDGNTNASLTRQALSDHLKIEQRVLSCEIDFLIRERLLAFLGPQGVRLTHEGIREVEEIRTRPDQATQHFLALNVLNIGSMVDSQINQASPSASQAGSALSPSAHAEQILDAIKGMEDLDTKRRSELLDVANRLLDLLRATPR
jgi:hypothetical protein